MRSRERWRWASGALRPPRHAVALAAATLLAPAAAAANPTVVRTIDFPGGDILGLALDDSRHKLFVSDDNAASLHVVDTRTYQTVASIPVGGAAFNIAVDKSRGRVYVASESGCCTTGVTQGSGLITVIDSDTNQKVKDIDPGEINGHSFFSLAADEARDRVFVAFVNNRYGYIDSSDNYMALQADPNQAGRPEIDDRGINPVTGDAHILDYGGNKVVVVDGDTLTASEIDLSTTGGRGPLDLAVNHLENKLYMPMISVPGQGEIGILILDRDTGAHKFVGKSDLAPLIFNPSTNRLFSGVQVGQTGAVVDGATDALTEVSMESGGTSGAGIFPATDHAYFASSTTTWILDGGQKCALPIETNIPAEGGLVSNSVVVDTQAGLAYVTNASNRDPRIRVIRDAPVTCPPPEASPSPPPPFPTQTDSGLVFSLDSVRAIRGGTIRLGLFLPGAGSVSARATATLPSRRRSRSGVTITVARRSLRVSESGPASLRLRPTAAARRALRRHKRLRARLAVTFTPQSGARVTRRRTLTLRAARRR